MNSSWLTYLPPFIRKRVEGRQTLQKIIGNTGWLLFDKVLRMGVGLFVNVWVVRYLGPDQFGLLSYVTALVMLFSVFGSLGLDGIVVRELVKHPEEKDEIIGSTLLLKFTGGIAAVITTLSFAWNFRGEDQHVLYLAGIIAASSLFQAADTIDFWFQSQVQSKYTVIAKNAAFLVVAVVKIVLILGEAPLIAFAVAATTEVALGACALLGMYVKVGNSLRNMKPCFARCVSLLRNSWPLLLSSLAVIVYTKIDQVMLGAMAGNAAVGLYGAAVKISEIWYMIPMVIVSSVFPTLIEARKQDEAFYYRRLKRLFRLMSGISLSIAIPMTFLGKPLMTLLYGDRFVDAGAILAVHIWAAVFVFLGVAQSIWDVAENFTRLALVRTSSGAVVNILLNYVLIPRYGAMGAAIATVVSYAVSSYLLNILSRRTRKIFLAQTRSLLFFVGE